MEKSAQISIIIKYIIIICLSVALIDSVYRTNKNYYPQIFLEECRYTVKEKTIKKYIIQDLFDSNSNFDSSDDWIWLVSYLSFSLVVFCYLTF